MSFSYNESLQLGCNDELQHIFSQIKESTLVSIAEEVVQEEMTRAILKSEFIDLWSRFSLQDSVTAEHIKNHFIIGLDGLQKVWYRLLEKEEALKGFAHTPLCEDVMERLEVVVDSIDFQTLFDKQIDWLNQA